MSEHHHFREGPAANARGEVFVNDLRGGKGFRIALDGEVAEFIADTKRANGQAFGPDGRLYAVTSGASKILAESDGGGSAG